jgi:hypothetical protein
VANTTEQGVSNENQKRKILRFWFTFRTRPGEVILPFKNTLWPKFEASCPGQAYPDPSPCPSNKIAGEGKFE